MIRFENVEIGHDKTLFKVRNLTLESGQVYILVGRNGSGKSTLLHSIIGQQSVRSGILNIDNTPVTQLNPDDFSKKIAFVRSTFPLVDYLEVSQYVALGRTPYTNALGRLSQMDHQHIRQAIDALEIQHLKGKFTAALSDGERQKVAIARAVAQDTPIILLDEPTAFLDYPNKQSALEFLQKIAQQQNKCILLSSHDIDLSIEANCPFLVIPSSGDEAQLLQAPINKQELLKLAFS